MPALFFNNFRRFIAICFLVFVASLACLSCRPSNVKNSRAGAEMPAKFLWAWERPEDLRFLDAGEFGVAFLAQTLILQNGDVVYRPRRQPLETADNAYLIAVTRIETDKRADARPTFSDEQKKKVVALVEKTLALPNVKAVQIDFDAAVSEREFYKNLLADVRERLPENVHFSMTALASWCVDKNAWFGDAPVDEAVPMAFEMGAQSDSVRRFLSAGNDWREPLCQSSYGVSIDEPPILNLKGNRRTFYFKSSAWEKSDLQKINR